VQLCRGDVLTAEEENGDAVAAGPHEGESALRIGAGAQERARFAAEVRSTVEVLHPQGPAALDGSEEFLERLVQVCPEFDHGDGGPGDWRTWSRTSSATVASVSAAMEARACCSSASLCRCGR
jgi:hypothetical protein